MANTSVVITQFCCEVSPPEGGVLLWVRMKFLGLGPDGGPVGVWRLARRRCSCDGVMGRAGGWFHFVRRARRGHSEDWRASGGFMGIEEAVSVGSKVIVGEIEEIGDGSTDRINWTSSRLGLQMDVWRGQTACRLVSLLTVKISIGRRL